MSNDGDHLNPQTELGEPAKWGMFATLSGAVAAAIATAACCLGPLIVAGLGVGGAGAMVALAPYRPYFMVGTALMLGLGFFMVYRKRRVADGPDECGCDGPAPTKKRNTAKIMLWVTTVTVVLFTASPYIIEATATAGSSAATSSAPVLATVEEASAAPVRVAIPVEGMDCVSCGVAIQRGMDNVGVPYEDFALDLEAGTVSFGFAGDPELAEAFASSIRDIGYEVGRPVLIGSES